MCGRLAEAPQGDTSHAVGRLEVDDVGIRQRGIGGARQHVHHIEVPGGEGREQRCRIAARRHQGRAGGAGQRRAAQQPLVVGRGSEDGHAGMWPQLSGEGEQVVHPRARRAGDGLERRACDRRQCRRAPRIATGRPASATKRRSASASCGSNSNTGAAAPPAISSIEARAASLAGTMRTGLGWAETAGIAANQPTSAATRSPRGATAAHVLVSAGTACTL